MGLTRLDNYLLREIFREPARITDERAYDVYSYKAVNTGIGIANSVKCSDQVYAKDYSTRHKITRFVIDVFN